MTAPTAARTVARVIVPDGPGLHDAGRSQMGTAGRAVPGARLEVVGVTSRAGGRTTLHDVSFSVGSGEVVAIVGGSGAGKSTLLETLVGLRAPAAGRVLVDGRDVTGGHEASLSLGYVPQEDIIHRDLPLARTLRYAASLRLPAGSSPDAIQRLVEATLARLDLAERAAVRVGSLSGGQRKRASIALELLTRPRLFFLDEPTSGLDPATSLDVMGLLRRLAGNGTAIVLTTHNPADIAMVDRVVFLARDGYLAFVGTPEEARWYFAVPDLARAYELLANQASPAEWAERFTAHRSAMIAAAPQQARSDRDDAPASGAVSAGSPPAGAPSPAVAAHASSAAPAGAPSTSVAAHALSAAPGGAPSLSVAAHASSAAPGGAPSLSVAAHASSAAPGGAPSLSVAAHASSAAPAGAPQPAAARPARPDRVGAVHQWIVLTRRNADLLVRNRLTLAVLAASPALVTLMMAVLFRPGSFDASRASPTAPAQTVFWVAFAGFFFGLTYGLLQIVGEMSILRRERLAGLSIGAYVASKVAVLTPVLVGVAMAMLAVLRGLGRLPDAGMDVYAALTLTIVLEAMAALALGLLASAAVTDAAQATLALPMLCFPQVLFAGAIVPVAEMAGPGRLISNLLANRWAFESLGRSLDVDSLLANMGADAGHQAAFSGSAVPGWSMLVLFTVVLLAGTVAVLRARTPAPRS